MSSDPVVEVEGVGKSYYIYGQPNDRLKQMIVPKLQRLAGRPLRQYYREFWALRDISFSVEPGETVGIIGRNGSGKSTLLQLIVGTLSPTLGTVTTRGRIAALLELGAGFNPEFTGRENALLNATILGLTPEEAESRIAEIESFADIGDFFDRSVKTYSSGMFIRVAFAVQASIEPDILVIDEALAVGDEKFQRKCFDRLEQLRDKGTSILLVTHSATTIERFCQRAILLHSGELHNFGPSNEVVDQYHALLYADQAAYAALHAKAMNTSEVDQPLANEVAEAAGFSGEPKAQILSIDLRNAGGEICEQFTPGDRARVSVLIKSTNRVPEMQIGIKIRTVEGVFSYGTSTLYYDCNLLAVETQETVRTDFDIELNLCEGAYFVTVAVADALVAGDMKYLDKQSDALFFRMVEPRVKAGGIAHLPVEIQITRQA